MTQFDTAITYELMLDGTTVQTLTYGINAWCHSALNSASGYGDTAKDLAAATYRYGASTAAYVQSLS